MKELSKANETIEKLKLGTSKLDKIISFGKPHGDKTSLRYIGHVGTSGSYVGTFVKTGFTTTETSKTTSQKVVNVIPT